MTYHEILKGEGRNKWGFAKIQIACDLAASFSHWYIWIDTCCIDKSSSAELSEAINSMYTYYSNSVSCMVYLTDVEYNKKEEVWLQEFRRCRWFTRGWTLQELLAPKKVFFYDSRWQLLQSKVALASEIESITGISNFIIQNTSVRASVAQKMSWASKRKTARKEDLAYCLLGLFNINMPLLYGEGERAFTRLQHEIIRHSSDESIFAWTHNDLARGMLAPSPAAFADSADVIERVVYPYSRRLPYSYTNKGIHFEIRRLQDDVHDLLTQADAPEDYDFAAPICCTRRSKKEEIIILYFKYRSEAIGDTTPYIDEDENRLERVKPRNLDTIPIPTMTSNTVVSKSFYVTSSLIQTQMVGFWRM